MERLKLGLDPRSSVMKTRPTRRKPGGKTTTIGIPTDNRYLELIRENPLRIIRSEAEYVRAIAMLDRLSDQGNGRTPDETEYLLALSVFVEKYEEEHHQIPPASGVDMIHFLIETHHRTQRDVANGTGFAVSTISEILAGKRKLGVKHIQALARFFQVKPAVFLDE
jgi:HTH-type transcriptional regulator / antitoxin HigA